MASIAQPPAQPVAVTVGLFVAFKGGGVVASFALAWLLISRVPVLRRFL